MKKLFILLLSLALVLVAGCSSKENSANFMVEAISENEVKVTADKAKVGSIASTTITVQEGELIESFFEFPETGSVKMTITPVGGGDAFGDHEMIGNGNSIDNVEPGEYTLEFEVLEDATGTIQVLAHVKEDEMPNPWTMLESLDQLEGEAGFPFTYPESLKEGCTATGAMVEKEHGIAHVMYSEDVEGESWLKGVARKGIAANYNPDDMGPFSGVWADGEPVEIEPGVMAYYLDGNLIAVEWQDGDYLYSLYYEDGLPQETFLELMNQTK